MIQTIYIRADNIQGITSFSFNGDYDGGAYTATIKCIDHNVHIGSKVSVYGGYSQDNLLFTGYVKQINYSYPDGTYDILLYDELIKAVDYFVASSSPDSAYKIKNKSAEDLVRDILNMAQIYSYDYEPTNFVFGVHGEGEVNLVGAYDYIHGVADLLAYHIWATPDGTVHFRRRLPYVTDDDSTDYDIYQSQIVKYAPYVISDADLRNRIVVYGRGVFAEAKASSPYLPSGFYKSVVMSSPHIDDQQYAQQAADYNLQKLNHLTERLTLQTVGIDGLNPLDIVYLHGKYEGKWLVYSFRTTISKSGYIHDIVLSK